jgi:putative transcriptional regulator
VRVESHRGKLLIATPVIVDPNFRRTVVLLAEHTEEGAMGLVLNRPSDTLVSEAVPPLEGIVPDGEPVYVGGPVEPSAVVVLAEFDEPEEAGSIVVGDIGFVVADPEHAVRPAAIRRSRVYAGYSGWSAEQLESELEEEAWFVEPARPDDVFADADALWSDVLRRKGGEYSVIAMMPEDPSLN